MKTHDDASPESAVEDEEMKNADSDEEQAEDTAGTFQEICWGRKRTTKSQVRHFRLVRNMDEVMESGFVYRKMLAVDIPMLKSGPGLDLLRYLGLADFLLMDIPHLDKPSCDEFIRTYDGVSKVGKIQGVNVVLDAASVAASLKLPLGRQDLQETLITSIHRKDQHDRLNEILNNSNEKRIRGYDLGQLLYVDQPVEIVSVIVSALMSKMECTKECFHYTTPEVLLAVDSAIQGVKVQWAGRFAENISRAVVKSQNWKNGTPTAFAFGEWLSKIISYQVNMQKARKKRKLGDTMEEVHQDAASFQELKELKASLKARDEEVKKLRVENERLGLVVFSLEARDEEVKKLMAENERLIMEVYSVTSARRKRKFGNTMEESIDLKALVEARDHLRTENERLMLEVCNVTSVCEKRVAESEEAKVRLANAAAESDARAFQMMNEKELFQRNLAEIKAECEQLKKDFNDFAKVKAEQLRKEISNDFNDVAKLKAENKQLKKDVNNFNIVAVKSGQQVAELNEQLKKAAKALNDVASNNGQQVADLKMRSEKMKRDMRKQIASVQMENQQLKKELKDNRLVGERVVGLRSDLTNCEKRAAVFKKENAEVRLELANSENLVPQLRIENGQLLKRPSDFDHAFDGLMTQNEQLRQNITWYGPAAIQTENERFMLDLQRLTVENQQVKAEIGILEKKNRRLQNSEEVSRLKEVSTKQVEQLKAQKEQEQKLRAELSAALQANVELGKLKEQLIYKNGDLSSCLNFQRQAVTRLENQNQGLVNSLAAKKSQLEKERLDLQEKLSQMRDNWEKSTQELKAKEEQFMDVDQAKVNDLSQEVARLNEQLEEKGKLILGFRVKETELSQEVAKFQNEAEILKQEKERVESSLRTVCAGQQKAVLRFKRQIDTVKARNEELQVSKQRAEDVEIGIRKAEEALSEKSRQIEQMKADNKQLERELSRVQAELEQLKRDDVKKTERWTKLKEDCEADVIRLNKEKDTEKRVRMKQINQLRSKENENRHVIDDLKVEVTSLQEIGSILKKEREGLEQELDKLMKCHKALKIHENEQLLAQKQKFNEILSKMVVMASEAINDSSMATITTSELLQ